MQLSLNISNGINRLNKHIFYCMKSLVVSSCGLNFKLSNAKVFNVTWQKEVDHN